MSAQYDNEEYIDCIEILAGKVTEVQLRRGILDDMEANVTVERNKTYYAVFYDSSDDCFGENSLANDIFKEDRQDALFIDAVYVLLRPNNIYADHVHVLPCSLAQFREHFWYVLQQN